MPTTEDGKKVGTKQQILEVAADLASAEGLEGLTIGRLASELGMSKSGLFGHFGSKQDLQLATIEAAAAIFYEEVERGPTQSPEGLERLIAMMDAWTAYVEAGLFSGGCFFDAASAEFDDRPGPVRDRIAELTGHWVGLLRTEISRACELAQLKADTDAGQIAFELHAFVGEANRTYQLHDDIEAFTHARRATQRVLQTAATDRGKKLLVSTPRPPSDA